MRRLLWSLVLVLGCGGGGGAGSDGSVVGGASGFTAKVDGQPWAAGPGVVAAAGGVPGGINIIGQQVSGTMTRGLTITLGDITGPGTYALGVGPGVYGGIGSVGEGMVGAGGKSNVWQTPLNGISGSITITALDAGHIVATFQFTGTPGRNNPLGGMRTVTEGQINLPLTGALPPVAANQGSKLSATLNGKPYNASTVTALLQGITMASGLNLSTSSSENSVSIILDGVSGAGTYTLHNMSPSYTLTAGKNGGTADTCCWGGTGMDTDVGTVTITSWSPARVQGTFSATLQAAPSKPATGPLTISDGAFDVGTGF